MIARWRSWFRRRRRVTGPPATQVFGPVKISAMPTPFENLMSVAQEWADEWAQQDWQEDRLVLNELRKHPALSGPPASEQTAGPAAHGPAAHGPAAHGPAAQD